MKGRLNSGRTNTIYSPQFGKCRARKSAGGGTATRRPCARPPVLMLLGSGSRAAAREQRGRGVSVKVKAMWAAFSLRCPVEDFPTIKRTCRPGQKQPRNRLCRLMAFSCRGSGVSPGMAPSLPFVSARVCLHTGERACRAVGRDSITFRTHPCVKEGRARVRGW